MRPLQVGLQVNTVQRPWTWSAIRELALQAEDVGFDSLWSEDHLVDDYDGELLGPWECWSILASLAAVTQRVTLGPIVSCARFRNPGLLAKIVTTVDEISGGRAVLGIGAGSSPDDFARFGWSWEERASVFQEALQGVRDLLHSGRADLEGRHYTLRDARLLPLIPRAGDIPIMVGAFRPWMLRIAARHADVWNTFWSTFDNRADAYREQNIRMDELCEEVGRDPATLGRSAVVHVELDDPIGLPVRLPDRIQPLRGSPHALAELLLAFSEAGADEIQLLVDPPTPAAVTTMGEVLRLLDR